MLSNAVHPPTTEHVYAQWHEREELLSSAPLGLLQEDNGQSFDVKEEEALSPMSGEPTSQNHFKTSRAVRLTFKGNDVSVQFFLTCAVFGPLNFTLVYFFREKGPAFKS